MDIPMDIKSMYFKDCSYNFQNFVKIHLMFLFFLQWKGRICLQSTKDGW